MDSAPHRLDDRLSPFPEGEVTLGSVLKDPSQRSRSQGSCRANVCRAPGDPPVRSANRANERSSGGVNPPIRWKRIPCSCRMSVSFASDFWKASMGNIGQPLLDHLSDHGYKNCIGHGAQFTGDPESQLFARPGRHPASSMNTFTAACHRNNVHQPVVPSAGVDSTHPLRYNSKDNSQNLYVGLL